MIPPSGQNPQKPMGGPQTGGPPLGPNMGGMYMPYQMDPRYYMGYPPPPPPPPPHFMSKKNE